MSLSSIHVNINGKNEIIDLVLDTSCVRDIAEALQMKCLRRPGQGILAPSTPLIALLTEPHDQNNALKLEGQSLGAQQQRCTSVCKLAIALVRRV
jgi:hypothetical protein